MKKYFGTDGVRGEANKSVLTAEFALRLGMAAASVLQSKFPSANKSVIIGRDPRISSDFLSSAFSAGCACCGLTVSSPGVVSTPAISFLTQRSSALFGAMISASHNPFHDNGIKLFSSEGIKIPDSLEEEIESALDNSRFSPSSASLIGKIRNNEEIIALYEEMILSQIRSISRISDLKVIIDCANGATSRIASVIFRRILKNPIFINDMPDGININQNCGSTSMENLCAEVRKSGADLGIAFDGDGDRALFCDRNGFIIDGDYILTACASFYQKNRKLAENAVVTTVMANLGMMQALKNQGITVHTVSVGDKYVYEKMISSGAVIGGEQSGHVIFREEIQTGDGILTAVKLLNILEDGLNPEDISSLFKKFPQRLKNLKISNRSDYIDNPLLQNRISELMRSLDGSERIVIRPSGTEPLLRIMAEASDKKTLDFLISKAESIIREHISVEE